LHNAAAAGNLEAVQVLLKAGANPNLESKAGTSPYSESLNSERSNVLAALEAGGGRLSMRQQSDRAYERAMRILVPLFW
jgi:ankyrin repeat protein